MAGVYNVDNIYRLSNRRAIGKVSFNIGDRFNGRILKKIDPASAIIRLGEGIDFEIDVEGDFSKLKFGATKFEVCGFKHGKLQLKIIDINDALDLNIGNNLSSNISNEIDDDLLQGLLKFNIPVTKENIKEIRGVFEFIEKINSNSEEIDKFIDKYLISKNIGDNKDIQNNLKGFLNSLKTLNKEDILFLKENNIDLNKNNIDSFNKLFKNNDENIFNVLSNLKESLDETNIKLDSNIKLQIDIIKEKIVENNIREGVENKVYEKQVSNNKIDSLSSLENISNDSLDSESQNAIKDINNIVKNIVNSKNEIGLKSQLVIDIIKSINDKFESNGDISKDEMNKIISKLIDKPVQLTDANYKTIKDDFILLKSKIDSNKLHDIDIPKEVKNEILSKSNEAKEILKDILTFNKYKGAGEEKVFELIKNSMPDIKLMNKINNEYYFFESPIKILDNEYPCKLIIKDNRKDGKKIDSKNIKLILSVNTVNLGVIDTFIKVLDRSMNIEFKCNEESFSLLDKTKIEIKNVLEKLGYISNISLNVRREDVTIVNSRGFFDENNRTNLDIKV